MAKFIVVPSPKLHHSQDALNNYHNTFQFVAPSAPSRPRPARQRHHPRPAWKIEAVSDGGNYVEPLYGRPRACRVMSHGRQPRRQ